MTSGSTLPDLMRDLAALGFRGDGGARFLRDGIELRVEEAWLTLHAPLAPGDPAAQPVWLDRSGPWKPGPEGQRCELPRRALASSGGEGEGALVQALEWARATIGCGEVAPDGGGEDGGREPPEVPAGALTVQAGALTRQGEVHFDGRRLWVDYRLAAIPGDLDPARRYWLEVVLDRTRRYRMVRVAPDAGGRALHARVDLTGLRPPARDLLFAQALPRLRAAVHRLLPAVDLLTDPCAAEVVRRALELGAPRRATKDPKRGPER